MNNVVSPVSLAEHKARIHRVEVPLHFPACSLVGQRDSQHSVPYSPLTPCGPVKGVKSSHLFNEQPGMAGPPQQRWLLQSMFEYGLQGWTQCPSYQVCHSFCDRVISSDRVLRNTKSQLSAYWRGGRAEVVHSPHLELLCAHLLPGAHQHPLP